MDRVMDMPVNQDVLTWEGGLGLLRAVKLSKPFFSRAPCVCHRGLR
jgi:hypothetical protein